MGSTFAALCLMTQGLLAGLLIAPMQDGGDGSVSSGDVAEEVAALNELVGGLKHVAVEQRGGRPVVLGWTQNEEERVVLERILAHEPELLDLTTKDIAQPDRMIEVDVIIVRVRDFGSETVGFDFLQLINMSFGYFSASPSSSFVNAAFNPAGSVSANTFGASSFFSASVDYNVNIANAVDEHVSVLARPHLTTLNGIEAEFQSGGEIVFQVSGIENGDIKPYPFGIQVKVTPTLLRSPSDDGDNLVMLDVDASRTSILGLELARDLDSSTGDISFDKTSVSSRAVLRFDETLILSGLYERESRKRRSGVPVLRDIPFIRYFFSTEVEVDDVRSTMIMITPRDPARIDEERNQEMAEFIQRRRDYVAARNAGTVEATEKFKEDYPDWYKPRPNRYASEFFMMANSPIYRQVSGDDLRTDALESGLWVTDTAEEAKSRRDGSE